MREKDFNCTEDTWLSSAEDIQKYILSQLSRPRRIWLFRPDLAKLGRDTEPRGPIN